MVVAARRSAAGCPGAGREARRLRHLEGDVAAMADDLGADLDQLLPDLIPIRDESFGGPAVELGVGLDEVGLVG
jgi:hypothetical protein